MRHRVAGSEKPVYLVRKNGLRSRVDAEGHVFREARLGAHSAPYGGDLELDADTHCVRLGEPDVWAPLGSSCEPSERLYCKAVPIRDVEHRLEDVCEAAAVKEPVHPAPGLQPSQRSRVQDVGHESLLSLPVIRIGRRRPGSVARDSD